MASSSCLQALETDQKILCLWSEIFHFGSQQFLVLNVYVYHLCFYVQSKELRMFHDKYHFLWNDFSTHLSSMFRDLAQSSEYADVTLVSDDRKQSYAHKFS